MKRGSQRTQQGVGKVLQRPKFVTRDTLKVKRIMKITVLVRVVPSRTGPRSVDTKEGLYRIRV